MAAVPWAPFRTVLVFHREHGGRKYVHLRTWNQNRSMGAWYPAKRSFVIPVQNAEALAEAIVAAGRRDALQEPPAWLKEREERDLERHEELLDLDASEKVLAHLERKITQRQKYER